MQAAPLLPQLIGEATWQLPWLSQQPLGQANAQAFASAPPSGAPIIIPSPPIIAASLFTIPESSPAGERSAPVRSDAGPDRSRVEAPSPTVRSPALDRSGTAPSPPEGVLPQPGWTIATNNIK